MPPDPGRRHLVRESYDRVATDYADQLYDELAGKPIDRGLLERLIGEVDDREPICDLGCGPGHIAAFLADRGARALGIDLSPGMVAEARRRRPDISFAAGDMTALPVAPAALGGVAVFYSLIHVPLGEHDAVAAELHRVLRPGGTALIAFHMGDDVVHRDEWWGHAVDLDFAFLQPDAVAAHLEANGLQIVDVVERPHYPGVEVETTRAYVFARRPIPNLDTSRTSTSPK